MKKILSLVIFLCLTSAAFAQKSPQEQYVEKYAPLAVEEMYRTGVPASITLAQGLLESRYGLSSLATQGNNHFGIKCHNNWTGGKMYHDDDKKGECFRAYDDAEQSFRDHSDFLRYRDRYKFLFENNTTDYKAWAYGLKKAGYATDPAYPEKLIKYIEDYGLAKYDTMSIEKADELAEKQEHASQDIVAGQEKHEAGDVKEAKETKKDIKKEKDTKKDKRKSAAKKHKTSEIPRSPMSLEEPAKYVPAKSGSFKFSLGRQIYTCNGVAFINSLEGETYSSIAESNKLFLKELLAFNDLSGTQPLDPGTRVFLQKKKKKTVSGLDKYIVEEDGVTLRDISQRFGITLKALRKLNNLNDNYILREGDSLKLR